MNYIQYLLKAKGRHGTHSPFIYKLVEKAIHENNQIQYPNSLQIGHDLNESVQKQIYRIALFLSDYYTIKFNYQFSSTCIEALNKILNSNTSEYLEIIDIEQFKQIKEIDLNTKSYLIIHPKNLAYQYIEGFYKSEHFKCTVFNWNFSLLLKSNDFKRKQHFVLK